MTLSGHAGPSPESCAHPPATSDYSRLSVARPCKAVLDALQVWYLRVNGWQVVVLCCRGFVVSNDATLFCATCGAQSVGVFAELLRTGWPTDCCPTPLIAVGVGADVIDAALSQILDQVVVTPPRADAYFTAEGGRPKASGRIPRRPV